MATQNTILTQSDFEALTTNPYFSNTNNNYYYSTTLGNLPQIIANVEVNLNAMLNGRLYRRYNPSNLKFNGYNGLSPQVEQKTSLQCLTECVEYRLITQQYVNLNNTYSGVVNGTNNYNTANSNVIGLRQDIQAKLSVLGLYANILLGDKKPNSVLMTDTTGGTNVINYNNLQEWITFIQQTNWTFNGTLTFNGQVDFANETSFFRMPNFDSGWGTPYFTCNQNLYGTSGSNIVLYGGTYSATLNGITYTFPQSMLDLTTPFGESLSDWSFFSEPVSGSFPFPQNYNQGRVMGIWNQPNGKVYLQSGNTTYTQGYLVIKCHNQVLNAIPSSYFTTATWYSIDKTGVISIDLQHMWNDAYNSSDWFYMTITCGQNGIPDVSQWTNYQIILDKVVGRVNFIGGVDSQGNASRTSLTLDPIYTGYVGLTLSPTINTTTNTFTVGGSIVSGGITSGTVSPWWSDSNGQSLSQINLALDVDFSIVLITD